MRWANNSDLQALASATPGVFASDEIERGPRQGFFDPLRKPALRGPHSGIRCTPADCDICFGRLVDHMRKESCETAHLATVTYLDGKYTHAQWSGMTSLQRKDAFKAHVAETSQPRMEVGKLEGFRFVSGDYDESTGLVGHATAAEAMVKQGTGPQPRVDKFVVPDNAFEGIERVWLNESDSPKPFGKTLVKRVRPAAPKVETRENLLLAALPDFFPYEREFLWGMRVGTMLDYNRDNGDVVRVSRSSEFEFVTMLVSTKQGRDRVTAQAQLAAKQLDAQENPREMYTAIAQARQQAYNAMAAHAQLTAQPRIIEKSVKSRDRAATLAHLF